FRRAEEPTARSTALPSTLSLEDDLGGSIGARDDALGSEEVAFVPNLDLDRPWRDREPHPSLGVDHLQPGDGIDAPFTARDGGFDRGLDLDAGAVMKVDDETGGLVSTLDPDRARHSPQARRVVGADPVVARENAGELEESLTVRDGGPLPLAGREQDEEPGY